MLTALAWSRSLCCDSAAAMLRDQYRTPVRHRQASQTNGGLITLCRALRPERARNSHKGYSRSARPVTQCSNSGGDGCSREMASRRGLSRGFILKTAPGSLPESSVTDSCKKITNTGRRRIKHALSQHARDARASRAFRNAIPTLPAISSCQPVIMTIFRRRRKNEQVRGDRLPYLHTMRKAGLSYGNQ